MTKSKAEERSTPFLVTAAEGSTTSSKATTRGESIRVMYPLFQVGEGGSIPTSPLQMRVIPISFELARNLVGCWHSTMPRFNTGFIKNQPYPCFGAVKDDRLYAVAIWSHPVARDDARAALEEYVSAKEAEAGRLTALINTPELNDFGKAVPLEAAHQRERWGAEHDEGKSPEDWFWVVGYLAGKALRSHISGDAEKAKHHTITCAALLANWHARINRDSRKGV